MPGAALSEKELKRRLDVFLKAGRNGLVAARELGIARATLMNSLERAVRAGLTTEEQVFVAGTDPDTGAEIELPVFPDDDVPIESVIDHMTNRFTKKQASYAAHTWFPVSVKESKPIGLLFVGDPHLDDNGANWPLIREHAQICKDTPGIYAVNIGDSTNNWAGRLIRKYADQDSSLKTGRRLVEWFLLDSGIRWLVYLLGNHDRDEEAIFGLMAKRFGTKQIVMHDWEARFVLRFPGGQDVRVYAAHDFPGNSMWNPLHGPVKAAMFGNNIDILVCGHKHHWAVSQWELPEQDSTPLMLRVRGYKHFDDFAKRIGKIEQKEGASILAVINPGARSVAGRVVPFVDVAEGADYLTWLRGRA